MPPISKDPVARLAEQQQWITPEAEIATQKVVAEALGKLGGLPFRRALHGTWLHEPLHAILVEVPVGAWTGTVAFDALAAITGPGSGAAKLDAAADATLVLGLLGATGAAITGMNDWAEIKTDAPRKIGSVHALLNVAATAVFVAALVARHKRLSRPTGRILAAVGYAIVSASAHLGGNLIYEHGIGVADTAKNDPLFTI